MFLKKRNPLPHLIANWPAPSNVTALSTSIDEPGNLALHVNDDPLRVLANRNRLRQSLDLPSEPVWLEQTHSITCVVAENDSNRQADAAISRRFGYPLVVMTADCLPILLCDRSGQEIAAIHAGWRGLCQGIVERCLEALQSPRGELMAWIGPAICSRCFEIGEEVRDAFVSRYPFTEPSFEQRNQGLYANLPLMAETILHQAGVFAVHQSLACTFEQNNRFYSYRRDGQTGRMATLIWLNQDWQNNKAKL